MQGQHVASPVDAPLGHRRGQVAPTTGKPSPAARDESTAPARRPRAIANGYGHCRSGLRVPEIYLEGTGSPLGFPLWAVSSNLNEQHATGVEDLSAPPRFRLEPGVSMSSES